MHLRNCAYRSLAVTVGVIAVLTGKAYSGIINGSTINVAGLGGTTKAVTVTLHDFNATNPSDVDVVVVGPTGAALVLLGGAGGTSLVDAISVTFDDTAAVHVTNSLTSGSFKPTQSVAVGSFPSPGPGLAYNSPATVGTSILGNANASGVFGGTAASTSDPNGTWSLYVMDAVSGDSTDIANGWSVNIQPNAAGGPVTFTNSTSIVVPTIPEPGSLSLFVLGVTGLAGYGLRRRLSFVRPGVTRVA